MSDFVSKNKYFTVIEEIRNKYPYHRFVFFNYKIDTKTRKIISPKSFKSLIEAVPDKDIIADDRIYATYLMIKKGLERISPKYKFNNDILRINIWLGDEAPTDIKDIHILNLYCMARPKDDVRFRLLPDSSFEMMWKCNKMQKLTDYKNFDEINEDIKKYKVPKTKIKNEIYFKGFNSTKKFNTDLRNRLSKDFPKNIHINNEHNIDGSFEPLHVLKNYKYLLNLPGHGPWSNRLKFLFLFPESIVVNVDYGNYETFFEKYFFPNDNIGDYLINFKYEDTEECYKKLVTLLKNIKKRKPPVKKLNLSKKKNIMENDIYEYIKNNVILENDKNNTFGISSPTKK